MMKVKTQNACEIEYVELREVGNEAIYLIQMQGKMEIRKIGMLLLGNNESFLKLAIDSTFH